MIAIKAIEMQHNNSSGNNHLQQQQQAQQHNLRDNYNVWGNVAWGNVAQQQQRTVSWINEGNKQRHINNNNINVNYNQQLTQTQPQYMQQVTYNNYTHTVPATTSQSSNCYYPCVQQQQQQQQFLAPTTTSAAVSPHQQIQNQQQAQQQHQQQRQDYSPAQAVKYAMDHQQRHLGTFDGIQSAPTLTTPTLTPTTMRSIEESFYEMTNDPVTAPYQAGFKPPPLAPLVNNGSGNGNGVTGLPTTTATATVVGVVNTLINQQAFDVSSVVQGTDSGDSNSSWGEGQNNDDQDTDETSSAHTDSTSYQNGHMPSGSGANGGVNNFSNVLAAVNSGRGSSGSNTNTSNSATPARRGGGRRPNRSANMTPEEEEKRRIRRERNKQAAARCRKRRVDQTNELTEEVEQLEKKGDQLRKEMESLTEVKKQLAYFLQAHRSTCSKVRADLLSVNTCNGLIAPVGLLSAGSCGSGASSHHNNNSNDSSNGTITGMDATLNSTGRSNSPLDLKPVPLQNDLLMQIKDEPLDGGLDSSSSLDQDGPPPSKRFALPPMSTLMTPTGASTGSLQTPMSCTAPSTFGSAFPVVNTTNATNGSMNSPTLNALNKVPKERPNTLAVQRPLFNNNMHLTLANNNKPGGRTEIQGVPIQTPSTGVFNFDSLMDGGTGLTPVSGPLVPNSSSQNKHPLELPTPTAEPSKLVSL